MLKADSLSLSSPWPRAIRARCRINTPRQGGSRQLGAKSKELGARVPHTEAPGAGRSLGPYHLALCPSLFALRRELRSLARDPPPKRGEEDELYRLRAIARRAKEGQPRHDEGKLGHGCFALRGSS
jgi:hypothetical protein